MDFSPIDLTPEQVRFREEVRGVLAAIMTPEVYEHEARTGAGFNEQVHLALGERGWIMPRWPQALGGAGLDAVQGRILELEISRFRVPAVTASTTSLVWSALEAHLDPELTAELRPGVARGRVRFALGYTEPDGGSDIAAAKVRAVPDGDEWVINGAKMFMTGAQHCQYTFLITRTDPALPKHKGLTMFLIPLDAEGVEIQAIRTYGGERTNAVYFGDVRILDRYRVGGVNAGWSVLRGPLDAEHSLGSAGAERGLRDVAGGAGYLRTLARALGFATDWARTATRLDGQRVAEDPVTCARLGAIFVELEAGMSTPGPLGRVQGSEALVHGAAELLDIVGPDALLERNADGAVAGGELEFVHRYAQGTGTYGGTTEVFRNIIAQHVLGLPQLNLPGRRDFLPRGGGRAERV
jgi:alkylation response protein AidB-like acyl-CoA dehydrogenase